MLSMDKKMSKKDINDDNEIYLFSEGSSEDMLMEYESKVFHETIIDPLSGTKNENHAGFALKIEDGLEFMHIKSKIPRDMTLTRKSHETNNELAIYFFYGSTFDYYVENKIDKTIEGLINGIIIHNYSSNVKLSLLKDREFNFVVIRITKETLEKYFKSIAGTLREMLFLNKPVLIYENIDQNVLDHLKTVPQIQSVKTTSRYLIFGKSIELLSLTFDLLMKRNSQTKNLVRIPEYDHIVKAKDFLLSDWKNPPNISQLSKFMGMCPTKAKMLFKQVFGSPPRQYFKKKKIEIAYQMIMETNLDIAEIGQQLGYKNLSHFSCDFYKNYGIRPKKFSMQIKGLSGQRNEWVNKGKQY